MGIEVQELMNTLLIALLNLLVVLVGAGATYLWRRYVIRLGREEDEKTALNALQAGVQSAWEAWVRQRKMELGDGKLSLEERARARADAIAYARAILSDQGKDLFKIFAVDRLPDLIAQIVEWRKRTE